MATTTAEHFAQQYQTHLKDLKLKGLQPKTIEAYSLTIRRVDDWDHLMRFMQQRLAPNARDTGCPTPSNSPCPHHPLP